VQRLTILSAVADNALKNSFENQTRTLLNRVKIKNLINRPMLIDVNIEAI
jgi:hypothetical protein